MALAVLVGVEMSGTVQLAEIIAENRRLIKRVAELQEENDWLKAQLDAVEGAALKVLRKSDGSP